MLYCIQTWTNNRLNFDQYSARYPRAVDLVKCNPQLALNSTNDIYFSHSELADGVKKSFNKKNVVQAQREREEGQDVWGRDGRLKDLKRLRRNVPDGLMIQKEGA